MEDNGRAYYLVALVKIYEYSVGMYFVGLSVLWDFFASKNDLRLKDEDFR